MRLVQVLSAVVMATVLLSGCGEESSTETVKEPVRKQPAGPLRTVHITINGKPGPENVGVLMAEERGYFEDLGLDVSVYPPETPRRPIPYVLRRWADLSISHEPEVASAQEKGLPIVAVGSLISEPTAALIWLEKSKIDGIADLEGKTIAIPGLPFQKDLLRSVLARGGLSLADVKVDYAGYDLVPDLISGRADAIFGGSGNVEGAELEARGMDPVVTDVQDLGVPSYDELVLISRRDRLAKDPQSIRDFISAVERGTAAAAEDPQAAAEAIVDRYLEANPEATIKGVEATLPLLSTPIAAGP